MKKTLLTLFAVISVIASSAQTITVPTDMILRSLETDSDPYLSKYINNQLQTGAISFNQRSNGNTIYDINTSVWEPDAEDLDSIVSKGGEVNDFLMVLKIPIGSMNAAVHSSLPDRLKYKFGSPIRNYDEWFNASDMYMNAGETFAYCITVTSKGTRLSATQILFILSLSGSVELLNDTDTEFTDIQNP